MPMTAIAYLEIPVRPLSTQVFALLSFRRVARPGPNWSILQESHRCMWKTTCKPGWSHMGAHPLQITGRWLQRADWRAEMNARDWWAWLRASRRLTEAVTNATGSITENQPSVAAVEEVRGCVRGLLHTAGDGQVQRHRRGCRWWLANISVDRRALLARMCRCDRRTPHGCFTCCQSFRRDVSRQDPPLGRFRGRVPLFPQEGGIVSSPVLHVRYQWSQGLQKLPALRLLDPHVRPRPALVRTCLRSLPTDHNPHQLMSPTITLPPPSRLTHVA